MASGDSSVIDQLCDLDQITYLLLVSVFSSEQWGDAGSFLKVGGISRENVAPFISVQCQLRRHRAEVGSLLPASPPSTPKERKNHRQ